MNEKPAPEEILAEILRLMGFPAPVRRSEDEQGGVLLEIQSDEGIVIGRRGRTLEALEWVLRVILGSGQAVRVDCGGYRERQHRMLEDAARRAIEQVRARGKAVTLGPYLPAERRIIHQVVSREEGMDSKSEGEGAEKWIRVIPSGRKTR